MKTLDKILIKLSQLLVVISWLYLFIIFFNFPNQHAYYWCCLTGITFLVGFWKDYRNCEFKYYDKHPLA